MHDQNVSRARSFPFIDILCPSGFLTANDDRLWKQGILGIETIEENDLLERHRIYFQDREQLKGCRGMLAGTLPQAVVVEEGQVEYRDWESFLHGGFEPLRSGPLYVVPQHDPPEIPAGLTPLYIVPGRGFGTGSHPTTRLCLDFLTATCSPGDSILDIGTGSGILAIAGAKLGAQPIEAVDIDADALENARENAVINDCADMISFARGSIEAAAGKRYRIVCANIIAHVLRNLLEQGLKRLVAPGGLLIASGILADELPAMEAAFSEGGLVAADRRILGDWAALLLRRQDV